MRVLIAEDEAISRRLLVSNLKKWGYEVIETSDGAQAWEELSKPDSPNLAIVDWMMPEMDGVDICRKLRSNTDSTFKYIVLLTARSNKEDIVAGLESGADDYIQKPFDQAELRQRIRAGERIVRLQRSLEMKVEELQEALDNVRQLQGILPMCAWCRKVRDDDTYWMKVEDYFEKHSMAAVSHGICPNCAEEMKGEIEEMKASIRRD